MAIQSVALNAYNTALDAGRRMAKETNRQDIASASEKEASNSFADTIKNSLHEVNKMQAEKSQMIQAFASGEEQNVHELMITLQKASTAMSMTNAVRGKVMESYKEIMRMSF